MKKLLALVLALIMVLGLGVTAFAEVAVAPKVINLGKEDDEDEDLEEIEFLPTGLKTDTNEYKYLIGPDGGDFYVEIKTDELKNITVSATGNVSAELVKFDGETMEFNANDIYGYGIFKGDDRIAGRVDLNQLLTGDDKIEDGEWEAAGLINDASAAFKKFADAQDYADILNKVAKKKVYTVKAVDKVNHALAVEKDLLKITVEENYTAAYKEGTVKLTAYNKGLKKDVVAEIVIISDVSIFEYEQVKWAVEDGEDLLTSDGGYSDYFTAKYGYSLDHKEYDEKALRTYPNATVVSTTAFRAIEGETLTVAADDDGNYVEIEEVAKGQKGVNFAWEGFKFYDEDDEKLDPTKDKVIGEVDYVTFGFLGNQVINSDFTVYVAPRISYYELREYFGKKVEEEDVITYYVLKDGVKIDEFTVDYAEDEIFDDVELEILGKAGDKLGFYTLTLDAPAAEEGEENPNTGAESVVGVVAAMAVISLATAAAVSLKK